MNSDWQAILGARGAHFADGAVQNFGNAAAELAATAQGSILTDLSHLGLLEVSGDDAATFLQGQLTNDIKQLSGDNSHYSGYCNAKGRLLAIFLAFAHPGHYHLQLDGALTAAILKRLRMYVLRSKVTITDMTDQVIRIGAAGDAIQAAMQGLFGALPEAPYGLLNMPQASIIRLPGIAPRYEIFTRIAHAESLWDSLSTHAQAVGKAGWDWLEIHAGIPQLTTTTQEQFVPQMLNLDCLQAINFKKGCYTGQEIVARTHYLGKVKRRTLLAHVAAAESPQPGDKVFGGDASEAAGMVVSAARAPGGGYDLLAELRLESLGGSVYLAENGGLPLTLLPMPYSWPEG